MRKPHLRGRGPHYPVLDRLVVDGIEQPRPASAG
jgi:hypothetical protein